MDLKRSVAVLLASLWWAQAGAARATVLWRGGFETGDLGQWYVPSNNPERRTIVRDPVREGSYAARIEIRPGDNSPGLNRVEISTTQPASTMQENAEVSLRLRVMSAADHPFVKGSHAIAYWEGSPPNAPLRAAVAALADC